MDSIPCLKGGKAKTRNVNLISLKISDPTLSQLYHHHQSPCSTQWDLEEQKAGEIESNESRGAYRLHSVLNVSWTVLDTSKCFRHMRKLLGSRVLWDMQGTPAVAQACLPRPSPLLTWWSCEQASLRADCEAARGTPAQFPSPLPCPSGGVSSNTPKRQCPGPGERSCFLSCDNAVLGALRPTHDVHPGHSMPRPCFCGLVFSFGHR